MSGCFSASAGIPLLIQLMHETLSLKEVFLIFTVIYTVFGVAKLIFWTPVRIPRKVDDDYSLWENTYIRQCGKNGEQAAAHKKPSSTFLFRDVNFYILCIVYGLQLRCCKVRVILRLKFSYIYIFKFADCYAIKWL